MSAGDWMVYSFIMGGMVGVLAAFALIYFLQRTGRW